MSEVTNNWVFTICIPSFNRGKRVYDLVAQLMGQLDVDWSILVLDNDSVCGVEFYEKISDLADVNRQIHYFRQKSNLGFHGNFLSAFEQSDSDYIMVLSDEDFPNLDYIRKTLSGIDEEVGAIRGSVDLHVDNDTAPVNCIIYPEQRFSAGKEALSGFSFINNYVSGVIYNRKSIMSKGLLKSLRENVIKQQVYIHLYLDMIVGATHDMLTTSRIACFEGRAESFAGIENKAVDEKFPGALANGHIFINYPFSFGERVNQFVALRDAVFEAVALVDDEFDINLFAVMYLRLCEKYYFLITRINVSEFVNDYKLHPYFFQRSYYEMCRSAIALYTEYDGMVPAVLEKLDEVHEKWEVELQEVINRMTSNTNEG